MQILIIVLFILAIASFVIQLQVLKNNWLTIVWLAVVALFVYFMHHYAIEQSYKSFRAALTNNSLMMDFTVLQVIEALGGLLLSISLIRSNYNELVKKFFQYANYLPGVIVFPALFYLESIVFLQVQGIDFELLAAGVAMLAVGIILISIWVFKKLIPEFDLQLEMKFIVHLLQLIGGIILSVVMLRLPVHSGNQEIAMQPILVLMTIVLAGVIVGMFWYHFKIKRISKNIRRVS